MLSSSALSSQLLGPPPVSYNLLPGWPLLSTPPSPSAPLLKFGIDQILEDGEGSPPKRSRRCPAPGLPSIAEYLRSPLPPPPCWPPCCLPPSPLLPFPSGLHPAPGKLPRRLHASPGAVAAAAAAAAGLGGRKCEKCACPYCLDAGKQRQFALAGVKKLHACHLCEKTFQKTSHLRAHINGHNGVRPFVCTWLGCGKSFTRSDELQRHWRTHSGVKHFVCEVCDKGFTRSDHLKKHKRTHVLAKEEEEEERKAAQTKIGSPDRSSSSSLGPRGEVDEDEDEYIDVMD